MTAPADRDLILRACRGDGDAFGELVTRYQASAFNDCYRMTNERRGADDLARETSMRVYSRLGAFGTSMRNSMMNGMSMRVDDRKQFMRSAREAKKSAPRRRVKKVFPDYRARISSVFL